MDNCIPDIYQKSVYTIEYDKLKERGIKCLLFDLDNTLVPLSVKKLNKKIKDLLEDLKNKGFKIIIFSNASEKRIKLFLEEANIEYVAKAKKPFKYSFNKIISSNNYNVDEVAIIGDEILVDILGGNRIGITTILVNPLSTYTSYKEKILKKIETLIMKRLRDKELFVRGKYYE